MLGRMTRILILLTALAAAITPAAAAERHYSVTDFDRIVVEGPFIVRLSTGRATSATASGSTAALDRLMVVTNDQTLRIRRDRNRWGGNPGAQEGPVTIELVTRNLRSVRLIGPASIDIDRVAGLRVENAAITSTTTGSIALGVNRAANVNALGLGTIDIIGRADCTRRGPNADLVRCDVTPLDQR